jgi:eukaryotic-like serine/threonine-protein kinase
MILDADPSDATSAVLQRLMTQLDRRPDLPALASTLARVQRIARDASSRMQALSAAVVDDPGLSGRLLRVANAVHYRSAGGGSIASVQRAIAVMGVETVQRLAITVQLLDRIPHDARGQHLREDFLQAMLAGRLAAELCPDVGAEEEAHLTAIFQNLGVMLLAACLPDEALAVRRARGAVPAELGMHVARGWGWPAALVQAMRRDAWPAHRPPDRAQGLRWLGWAANDLAHMMLTADDTTWDAACAALAEQAGPATGRSAKALQAAVAAVQPDLQGLAQSVGLMTTRRRAEAARPGADPSIATPTAETARVAEPPAASPSVPVPVPVPMIDRALLTREALRLTTALVGRSTRADVPARALDTLWRGLAARRAVLWRAEAESQPFAPAVVLGQPLGAQAMAQWRIDPRQGRDLFARLCAIGNEALIHDAQDDEIQAHLPTAFRRHVGARRFVVLPLQIDTRPLGMIYLDRDDDVPFTLDGDDLQLVTVLRDHATLALAHAD